jgi:NAD(P)-dependent dehydrogenase (short-subunit alcohol dehydrogenase family)
MNRIVLVVGGTGTIGSAVAERLREDHTVIVAARRNADVLVDVTSPHSIGEMYAHVGSVDAVVSTVGSAVVGGAGELTEDDYLQSFSKKVLGQISLVRLGLGVITRGGSVTLTGGVLGTEPHPGYAAISMVNAALDGFCRAAAVDLRSRMRVNIVSPVFVAESFANFSPGEFPVQSAADTASAYVSAVTGSFTGRVVDPRNVGAQGPDTDIAGDNARSNR